MNAVVAFLLFAAGTVAIVKAIWRDIRAKALWDSNPASQGCWTFALLCTGLGSAIQQTWWIAAPSLLMGAWQLREGKP